jgi:hypothetical protein
MSDTVVFESAPFTDYWTCNVGFASGIAVPNHYDGWPPVTRYCRGLTPIFFRSCFRCGMPRGWEKRPRRTSQEAS